MYRGCKAQLLLASVIVKSKNPLFSDPEAIILSMKGSTLQSTDNLQNTDYDMYCANFREFFHAS
jgi:hypothetical protein